MGQRLACTLNESESTKSVNQLSRLPTNTSRWIKHQVHVMTDMLWILIIMFSTSLLFSFTFQDSSKLACRTVPLHQTRDLLANILTLIPRDSADFTLASNLSDAFRSLISWMNKTVTAVRNNAAYNIYPNILWSWMAHNQIELEKQNRTHWTLFAIDCLMTLGNTIRFIKNSSCNLDSNPNLSPKIYSKYQYIINLYENQFYRLQILSNAIG